VGLAIKHAIPLLDDGMSHGLGKMLKNHCPTLVAECLSGSYQHRPASPPLELRPSENRNQCRAEFA
jgi:hypothetical protein